MKFTQEHEWLREEGDTVVVGITAHASQELGDVVFVELPEVGTNVTQGEEVAVIESVKAASDILAPVDGEIMAVNQSVVETPAQINEDPEGAAWFFKIKPTDPGQMEGLMDADAYKEFTS